MDFKELHRLVGYDIPIIEVLDKHGELVFRYNLRYMDLYDIDIIVDEQEDDVYGVVILKENDNKGSESF